MEINSDLKVKIRVFGDLNYITNEFTENLKENAGLEDLSSILKEIRKGLYKAGSDFIVLINGQNMDTLKKSFSLNDGDFVELIPLVVGG